MSSVYELLVLTVPQAAVEGKEPAKDKVEALIGKQKGKILTSDDWGERLLTFPIKKYDRGNYLLYVVEMTSAAVKQLETKLTLEHTVLRHLLVKKPRIAKKEASVN
jgi:small subunit ribosomal protein S6